jgi:hypothetical protein
VGAGVLRAWAGAVSSVHHGHGTITLKWFRAAHPIYVQRIVTAMARYGAATVLQYHSTLVRNPLYLKLIY